MKFKEFKFITILTIALFLPLESHNQWFDYFYRPCFRVEMRFLTISESDLRSVEDELNFTIEPPDGKALLTAKERSVLIQTLEKSQSYESLAITILRGHSYGCNQTDSQEEIPYVADYALKDANTGETIPAEIDKRMLGSRVHFHIGGISKDKIITVLLDTEFRLLNGYDKINQNISQPVFKLFGIETTLYMPDGMTFVAMAMVPKGMDHFLDSDDESKEKSKMHKCYILLFTINIEPDKGNK